MSDMNKKPGLLLAVSLLAIIVLAVSFNMNLGGDAPVKLNAGVNPDNVLYVCEITKDSTWNQVSQSLHMLGKYATFFFSFVGIVLCFSWGWALYQNLLKDKFSEDVYKKPWTLTKAVFWIIVCFTVLFVTPNHFRRVEIRGHGDNWVFCDNTSDGARPVNFRAVELP